MANGRMGETAKRRDAPPGGEPLWIAPNRSRDICRGACRTANLVKQAAPGNVSTWVKFIGASRG